MGNLTFIFFLTTFIFGAAHAANIDDTNKSLMNFIKELDSKFINDQSLQCELGKNEDACDFSYESLCKDETDYLLSDLHIPDEKKKPIYESLQKTMSVAARNGGFGKYSNERPFTYPVFNIMGSGKKKNSGASWVLAYQKELYQNVLNEEKLNDPWQFTLKTFENAKSRLIENIAKNSDISEASKKDFIKEIKQTILANPFNYMMGEYGGEDQVYEHVTSCGDDGMKTRFHFKSKNCDYEGQKLKTKLKKSLIRLCPADLLKIARTQNASYAQEKLDFIFSHELGHAIAPLLKYGPQYVELNNCISKRLSEEVPLQRHPFSQKGMFTENIADQWALINLNSMLENKDLNLDQKRDITRNVFKQFCIGEEGEKGNLTHFAMKDRIDLVFARKPSIRKLLNCYPNTLKEKSCGLKGEE